MTPFCLHSVTPQGAKDYGYAEVENVWNDAGNLAFAAFFVTPYEDIFSKKHFGGLEALVVKLYVKSARF